MKKEIRITPVLRTDPASPDPCVVAKLAEILERGGVVAYPTETLYGLGVDPFQVDSLARIYGLKGRSEEVPISILIKDLEMLRALVSSIPRIAEELIHAFLPGPLTLVLQARPGLPKGLTGGTGKIGVRMSSHPVVSHLFSFYSSPLTTTSANPTGLPPATNAAMVQRYFPKGIDCILDGGPVLVGTASTVVDVSGDDPVVLRDGAISREDISGIVNASFPKVRVL